MIVPNTGPIYTRRRSPRAEIVHTSDRLYTLTSDPVYPSGENDEERQDEPDEQTDRDRPELEPGQSDFADFWGGV